MNFTKQIKNLFQKISVFEYFLFLSFFIFSSVLMWKTFRLDTNGNMLIASKAWSDFAATIPLVRSFSLGYNWPPEYPIFAGLPIRYHFIFYFLVGQLEKLGLPISWALNIPSIFGFTILLIAIYSVGKSIFSSAKVGAISVLLFLFNGSFSFINFFENHQFSSNILTEITSATAFSSFGPYDGKTVSAFWNLNIYTNQRHLAFAYATFLFMLLYLHKKFQQKKLSVMKAVIIGSIIGLFPFIHYPVFGMLEMLLAISFIVYPKLRKEIFIAGFLSTLIAIPQLIYMGKSNNSFDLIHPGYLIDNLNTINFIKYWFLNLGFASILAPIGFLIASKEQKKIFIPFLALFIIGNIFRFSPEAAANHKFFNLFIIGLNFFAANLLVRLWCRSILVKPFVMLIIFLMTLSGILDIFPIINDHLISIEDIPNNKAATYINENTSKDSVFLNSSFLYTPASIAGRKIMMGWPYFAWSAGYDTDTRGKLITKIFTINNKEEICKLLLSNKVDYLTIQDTSQDKDFPFIDRGFFSNYFISDYSDGYLSILSTSRNCNKI